MRINNRLDFVLEFGTIELPCKVQVWLRAQGCGACGLGFRVRLRVWSLGLRAFHVHPEGSHPSVCRFVLGSLLGFWCQGFGSLKLQEEES